MPLNSQFNTTKSTSFLFTISNKRDLTLKVQSTSIGAVNLGSAQFPIRQTQLTVPDNTLQFDPMTIRFIVSEDLSEWFSVLQWMVDITQTNDAHLTRSEVATLSVLNMNNQEVMRIVYKSIFPITLGDLLFSVVDEEISLSCDLALDYDSYDVINVKTGEKIQYGANY
jgi:hypothetical protein